MFQIGCFPFWGSRSVVIDSLLAVPPIGLWGFCVWSMFCYAFTGHFQSFFLGSFSELFFFFFFFFFNISRKNSKTSKANQQSVLNFQNSGQDNHFLQCHSPKYTDRTSK